MKLNIHKKEKNILLVVFGLNLILAVLATKPFSESYPIGMDSFSHLPKVLYLSRYGFSQWFFDWYCGFPYLVSYAPLAYIFAYLLTFIGVNPTLSYKLTEIFFLTLTPFAFYKLAKKLGLEESRAAYATLIFSVFPSTTQNYLVFGRFTNIVSYPFLILTLIFMFDVLECFRKRSFILASTSFCLTLLTHHFSAYILLLIMVICFFTLTQEEKELRKALKSLAKLIGILLVGCVFSSFWLIPYYTYKDYWTLTSQNSTTLLASLTLLALTVVLASLTVKKAFKPKNFKNTFILVWMFIFIFLGSGFLPLKYFLPFGGEVDFLRFQLYLAIPLSLLLVNLEGYSLGRLGKKFLLQQKLDKPKIWFLVVVVLNILIMGIILQVFPTVLAEEVWPEEPPPQLIQYIRERSEWGRILPIDCPFWVYSLPHLTGKPLVDGWYPQGCILSKIKFSTRKTINHYSNETILKHFIDNAKLYGIKWVLVGNNSKTHLLKNSGFHKVLETSKFMLFENSLNLTYIETNPKTSKVKYIQRTDSILISLETKNLKTKVLVKETYFPGWIATENNKEIPIYPDENGFICFNVYGVGEHTIILRFNLYKDILQRLFGQ